MIVLQILILLQPIYAWLRYGARNCKIDCFDKQRLYGLSKQPFYCRNGREMGWCCNDDSKFECQEYPEIEMACNYGQAFNDQLKYFSCIRESSACGTSQTQFYSVPGMNQTLSNQKIKEFGKKTTYGEVCWYEILQADSRNLSTNETRRYIRVHVNSFQNVQLQLAVGKQGSPGDVKNITGISDLSDYIVSKNVSFVDIEISHGNQSLYLLTYPVNEQLYWNFNINYTSVDKESLAEIDIQQSYISNKLQEVIDSITINKEWFWKWLFVLATFLTMFYAGMFVLISMMDFSNEQEFDRRRKYELQSKYKLEQKQRVIDTDSQKLGDEDDDLESEGEVLDEDEDDIDDQDGVIEPQFGGLARRRQDS